MNLDYTVIFSSMKTTVTLMALIVLVKYYIYLMFAPFYPVSRALNKLSVARKVKKGILPYKYEPKVSIIIPAWNEEVGILNTVHSALSNTYENIEVVVVNDGSTDRTDQYVRAFKADFDKNNNSKRRLIYFFKPNGGKGAALNFGIKKSSGEIVVTMDADSMHDKNAIKNLVAYFRDGTVDAVVGNVKISNTQTLVGLIQKLEYMFGFYFKRVHSLFNAEYIYGGACAAFRRSTTFDKLGYFDTVNKTEDIEYSMRTKLFGLKSVYAEDVLTYTEGASNLTGLYKQRLRWKKGRVDTFMKYKSLFFSRSKNHSKFLTWIVLPYALIGELQMLFEPMFFTLIWTYTFVSGDFLSLGLSSLFVLFTYFSAIVFGDRTTNKLYIFSFPATWLAFYVLVAVEFISLLKTIEMISAKQEVEWQSWARQGIGATIQKKYI